MEYFIGAFIAIILIIGFVFFYKVYVNKRLAGKFKRLRLPSPMVFILIVCFLFTTFAVSYTILKPDDDPPEYGMNAPLCHVVYRRLNNENQWYTVETRTYDYNQAPDKIVVSTAQYYTFEGYYTDSDFTKEFDFEADYASGEYYQEIAQRIERGEKFTNSYTIYIYLKFVPAEFSITYHLNSGINHPDNPTTFNANQRDLFKDPSKNGYNFIGWYLDPYGYHIYDSACYYLFDLEVYAIFAEDIPASEDLSFDNGSTVNILNTTAEEIIIPAMHEGIFVRNFGSIAENHTVKRLYLPSTILSAGSLGWQQLTQNSLYNLKALEEIIISEGNEYYKTIDGLLYNKNGTELLFVPIGKTSVTLPSDTRLISSFAFAWSNATTVVFNKGLERIEERAFYFSSIEQVHLPNTLKYLGSEAFSPCFYIKSFTFESNSIIETLPHSLFGEAHDITTFTIPASVKNLHAMTFNWNTFSLAKILVEEGSNYFQSHEGALYSKDGKTLICIPRNFREGDYRLLEGTERIADSAAHYSNNSVKIFASASLREIGVGAFEASHVNGIYLDDINSLKSIGARAFWRCNIKNIFYSNDIEYIGQSAFYDSGITDLFIPKSINSLKPWQYSQGNYESESVSSNFKTITVGVGNTTFVVDENGFLYDIVDKILLLALYSYNFEYDEVRIMEGTTAINSSFSRVSDIGTLYLPASLQAIDPASLSNINIGSIKVSADNPYFCDVDGVLFSKDKTTLWLYPSMKSDSTFTLPDETEEIVNYALINSWNLEILYINANLKQLHSNDWNEMNLYNCTSLKEFIVSPLNTVYKSIDGVLYSKDGKQLVCYPRQKEGNSYTILDGTEIISEFAFGWTQNLLTIHVPESVHTMNVFAFYSIFQDIGIYLMRNIERDGGYLDVSEQFIDNPWGLVRIIVPKEYEEYYQTSPFFKRLTQYFIFE